MYLPTIPAPRGPERPMMLPILMVSFVTPSSAATKFKEEKQNNAINGKTIKQ